jgi:SAM-dependent methyltransferase
MSETAKVRDRVLSEFAFAGKGVDLGVGIPGPEETADKFLPGAEGIDRAPGPGIDRVHDLNTPLPYADGELDYVWSSHLLEHLADWQETLADWVRVLRGEGLLGLYLPHADYYDNAWNPEHLHELRPEAVAEHLHTLGMKVVLSELDVDDVPVSERPPERQHQTERYSFLVVAVKSGSLGQKSPWTCDPTGGRVVEGWNGRGAGGGDRPL